MEQQFALVDAAYCFLSRHRATLSVRNVVQMVQSLSPGAVSAAELRGMAAHAPKLLVLTAAQATQLQHRDDVFRAHGLTPDELELLSFPLAPQPSARASAKRKKLFAAALQSSASTAVPDPPVSAGTLKAIAAPLLSPPLVSLPSSPWVAMLQSLPIFRDQLVHVETRAARAASFTPLESLPLPVAVVTALQRIGIRELYAHQHESIAATLRGDNVVLSTSTASGKSLAFNVPTLASLMDEPTATFFYLFPTKALAQDQLKSLRRMLHACGLPERLAATFDGDTPMKSRSMVIRDAQIFLTNPDILHLTILAKHTQWKTVLVNLKLLVIDEAHMYRGVFGSHVASVFRRLFRLCAHYGSNPRVICCSATIRNPETHFRMLLPQLPPHYDPLASTESETEKTALPRPVQFDFFYARPLRVITQDGAPTGEKVFCVWNPRAAKYSGEDEGEGDLPTASKKRKRPATSKETTKKTPKTVSSDAISTLDATENKEDGPPINARSTSSIYQSAVIFARLVADHVHTILFCRGRKLAELVLMNVHTVLKEDVATKHLVQRVHSYRGGYTAEDRRRIETRLFRGELLGVVATNALELGIDIGELDCTMHLGLPGSISSLWQQAGRAGRRQHAQSSLAVIVCFDSPLDQHFARHATDLFQLAPEAVTLNANNPKIVAPHLLCAASEFPLFDTRSGLAYVDAFVFGSPTDDPLKPLLCDLAAHQQLSVCTPADGGGFRLHSCVPKSVRAINLRSIPEINYQVVTDDSEQLVLDQIPGELVFFQVYPTAVYLHQAQEYIITRLDIDQKVAFAKRCPQPLTYFTTCRDFTEVNVVKLQRRRKITSTTTTTVDDVAYVCEGDVSVTTSVFGSTLMEKRTMRVLHVNEFSLPPMQSFGHALWVELPHTLRRCVEAASFVWSGALHGVGHLILAVIPLFVLCDAGDLNTEHYNPFEQRQRPNRITVYERREGGSGLVVEIARSLPRIVQRAFCIARECACRSGCPSCVHSAQCTEYNNVLDKRGALLVLAFLAEAYGVDGEAEDDKQHKTSNWKEEIV